MNKNFKFLWSPIYQFLNLLLYLQHFHTSKIIRKTENKINNQNKKMMYKIGSDQNKKTIKIYVKSLK